ncbi:MAG: ferredoxin [Proteobacteria bacterium]|nr:ferredoxin [Pseudomonadota bacterium]
MKAPVVELGECILCGICVDLAPSVFKLSSGGYIEVADLSVYPEADVDDAIKNCPSDCILWNENQ